MATTRSLANNLLKIVGAKIIMSCLEDHKLAYCLTTFPKRFVICNLPLHWKLFNCRVKG